MAETLRPCPFCGAMALMLLGRLQAVEVDG